MYISRGKRHKTKTEGNRQMSYRCEGCGEVKKGRPNMVVAETRDKVYPTRMNEQNEVIDRGGKGKEIVKEVKLCDSCNIKTL